MKDLLLRNFSGEDYPQVITLWEKTGIGNAKRGDNLEVITRTIDMGGKLIILENSKISRVIGTSWLTLDGRRIYLHHFGIFPEYQGKGLSKLLLKESLLFAREKQMQIKLEVHKDQEHVIRLYQNAGFQYLGDYLVYIIRDINRVIRF